MSKILCLQYLITNSFCIPVFCILLSSYSADDVVCFFTVRAVILLEIHCVLVPI